MFPRRPALCCLFLGFTLCANAQFGGLMKSKPKPPTTTDKAPEYSEADKVKLAEIAQRPAIVAAIDTQWQKRRKDNLDEAYAINLTSTWGLTDDPISHVGYTRDASRLYSNPMMQMYVNNIGQRLVPKDSPNLYTFRILLAPLPEAFSLTTGSIYVSTGLLSMLDSEAQLSYILAHEIAHVEQKHVYNRIRNTILQDELNREKDAKNERNRELLSIGGAALGGVVGGVAKGASGAILGAGLGTLSGVLAGQFLVHNNSMQVDWSTVEENEADELGAKYMLEQNYDVREVPRLYASLDRMVGKDSRVGLGFMGEPRRVKERSGHIQEMIKGPMHEKIEALAKGPGLTGSGTTFPILLAAAKRDNGILAMQYDLFAMAQQNLEDALVQRSNDPSVHFYLSRVESLTARTPEDKRQAVGHITDALRLDASRGSIPDLHLELAMSMLTQDNAANKDQIITELKTYVALFQRDNAGNVPGNMSAIFDYFNLVGETGWYLPPQWYPATQLMNTSGSGSATLAPGIVVRKAIGAGGGDGAQPAPAPALRPVSRK